MEEERTLIVSEQRKAFSLSPRSYVEEACSEVRCIADAIRSETMTLGEMNRTNSEYLRILLTDEIGKTLRFMGFENDSADNRKIVALITRIVKTYFYLTMPDVRLCMQNAMDGRYEKFYGRLDFSVIMSWFKSYDAERTEIGYSIPPKGQKEALFEGDGLEELKRLAEEGNERAQKYIDIHDKLMESMEKRKGKLYAYEYNRKHRFDNKEDKY